MNYIEGLVQKAYKPGISNEEFLIQLHIEALLENYIQGNPQATESDKISEKEDCLKTYQDVIKITREKGHTPHLLERVLGDFYYLRRHIHFPPDKKTNWNALGSMLETKSSIVENQNKSGWHYRYPVNRSFASGGTKERFVVNANPDPKLIEALDKFCQTENAYYKVPEVERWDERVDTAVIYMQDHITSEQQEKFIQLMSPFVRQTNPQHTNSLDGELIATGIAKAKEVSGDDAKKYIAKLPSNLQEDVSAFLTMRGKIGMSLGQKCVLDEFMPVYSKLFPQNGLQIGHQTKVEEHKTIAPVKSRPEKPQPKTNLLKKLEALSQPSAPVTSKDGVRNFSELGMTKTSPTSLFYKKEIAGQNFDILDSLQMYKMLKNQDLKTVQNIYSRAIMCMHDCAKTPETNTQDYLLAYGIAFSCIAVFSDEAKKNNIPFDPIPLKNKYIETIEMVSNDIERGIIPSSTQLTQNGGFLINNKQLRRFDSRKYLEGIYKDGQFLEYNLEGMSFKSIKDSRAIIKDFQSLSSKHLVQSIQNQH